MSAILKFNFQKRKQLHFSEENHLNYKKKKKKKRKDTILNVTFTFFLKQRETRTSSGPIWAKTFMAVKCKESTFSFLPDVSR